MDACDEGKLDVMMVVKDECRHSDIQFVHIWSLPSVSRFRCNDQRYNTIKCAHVNTNRMDGCTRYATAFYCQLASEATVARALNGTGSDTVNGTDTESDTVTPSCRRQ